MVNDTNKLYTASIEFKSKTINRTKLNLRITKEENYWVRYFFDTEDLNTFTSYILETPDLENKIVREISLITDIETVRERKSDRISRRSCWIFNKQIEIFEPSKNLRELIVLKPNKIEIYSPSNTISFA